MKQHITLTDLEFESFRTFKEQQSIHFSESGLINLKGFNLNTGGSSAAGKSNLHLALSYALGYCPFPATELQSRYSDNKMQVSLTFKTTDGIFLLKRGKVNAIYKDNELIVEGSVKMVDAELANIIKIPLDLLDALTYRQQQSRGRFLSMADAEKKEFLAKLLNLDTIDPQIDLANKTINELEKKMSQVVAVLAAKKDALVFPLQPVLCDLEPLVNESFNLKQEIKTFEEQEAKTLSKVTEIQKEWNLKLSQFNTVLDHDIEMSSLRTEMVLINNKIDSIKKTDELEKKDAERDVRKLEASLKAVDLEMLPLSSSNFKYQQKLKEFNDLKSQKCSNCNQSWIVDENKLIDVSVTLSLLKNDIESFNKLTAIKNKLLMDLSSATVRWTSYPKKDTSDLTKKIFEISNKRDNLKLFKENEINREKGKVNTEFNLKLQPYLDLLSSLRVKRSNLITKLSSIDSEIKSNQELNKFKADSHRKNSEIYDNARKQIDELENELKSTVADLNQQLDFIGLLKGFLGSIFEEVLIEIADETNNLLKQIPNIATAVVQFQTEVISTKGIVRQQIKPVITKDGITVSLKAGLSGGQISAVELAVDLAIGNIIGRRIGVMPGWLVLDEAFDGLSVPEKEACLELLKTAAQDRIILVVDHASEIKDYFDHTIEIECFNDNSRIRNVN
jgi:DNA repair exonuclease SbcCD ATPase subunit